MQISQPKDSHSSLWSGTHALHTLSGPASAPSMAVQNVGAFLLHRCGTLEDAFSALDFKCVGKLTLESFVRGMQQLGYEGPLAESTRVFQAMDTAWHGSVELAGFLAVFENQLQDPNSHATMLLAGVVSTGLTTGPDSAGGMSAGSVAVDEESRAAFSSWMTKIEARVDAEVCRLRELTEKASARHVELLEARCLDVERAHARHIEVLEARSLELERGNARHVALSEARCTDIERTSARQVELLDAKFLDAERANTRHAELVEAKCTEICADFSEELKADKAAGGYDLSSIEFMAKLQALQERFELRLHDAELASMQHEVDLRAAVAKLDCGLNASDDPSEILLVQREMQEGLDSLRNAIEAKLNAVWTALEQEKVTSAERMRALGQSLTHSHTLNEEFERNVIVKASSFARKEVKEACDVTRALMARELQMFRKDSLEDISRAREVQMFRKDNLEDISRERERGRSSKSEGVQLPPFSEESRNALDAQMEAQVSASAAAAAAASALVQAKEEQKPTQNDPSPKNGQETVPLGETLEHSLHALIAKLDSQSAQCVTGLGPDLKQLTALLHEQGPSRGASLSISAAQAPTQAAWVAPLSPYAQSSPTVSAAASAQAAESLVGDAPAHSYEGSHLGDDSNSSDKGGLTEEGPLQKLREDVLGYLRSDFQKIVTSSLKSMHNQVERQTSPDILNLSASRQPARPRPHSTDPDVMKQLSQTSMSSRSGTPLGTSKVAAGQERSRVAGSREPQRLHSGPSGYAPRGPTLRSSQQSPRAESRPTDRTVPSVGPPSAAGTSSPEHTNIAPALRRSTTPAPFTGLPSAAGTSSSEHTNTAPALLRATTQGPPMLNGQPQQSAYRPGASHDRSVSIPTGGGIAAGRSPSVSSRASVPIAGANVPGVPLGHVQCRSPSFSLGGSVRASGATTHR